MERYRMNNKNASLLGRAIDHITDDVNTQLDVFSRTLSIRPNVQDLIWDGIKIQCEARNILCTKLKEWGESVN